MKWNKMKWNKQYPSLILSTLLLTLHYIFFSITRYNIGGAKPNSDHMRFTINDVAAYGTLNCYKNYFYIYMKITIILYKICTNKHKNKTCYKNDKAVITNISREKWNYFCEG